MKKCWALLFIPVSLFGQQTIKNNSILSGGGFTVDVSGVPFQKKDIDYLSGTPFNKDVRQRGKALYQAKEHTARFVGKLNLLDNQLHYLNTDGKEFIAESNLKEIILEDSIVNTTPVRFVLLPDLESAGSQGKSLWYQVLDTGRIVLLKAMRKQQVTEQRYGSATTEYRIVDNEAFYLMQAGEHRRLKSAKDLLEALPDKHTEMENFIKSMNRGQKLEDKLVKAMAYYNSLPAALK